MDKIPSTSQAAIMSSWVGDSPVPAVGSSDGTSRYKYRLDGISFTFKITANGFNNILLPSFKYRLTLSE